MEDTVALLKVKSVIAAYCIMNIHARRISLRSTRMISVEVVVLCACPALCLRRKRHLGTFYMKDLVELSCIYTGSLNSFIGRSEWFLD